MSKFILTLVAVYGFTQVSLAATPLPPLPARKLTLEVNNSGARDFIKYLLEESGFKFELPASLTNATKLNLEAKHAHWLDLFMNAIAQAGFQHSFDQNGVLKLTPIKKSRST